MCVLVTNLKRGKPSRWWSRSLCRLLCFKKKKKKNTHTRFKAFSDEAIRRISWLQSSSVWFPAGTPEMQKYSMTEVSSSCQMHSFRVFFFYFNNKNDKNKALPPPFTTYRVITCGNVWMQCAGTVSFHLSNCPPLKSIQLMSLRLVLR